MKKFTLIFIVLLSVSNLFGKEELVYGYQSAEYVTPEYQQGFVEGYDTIIEKIEREESLANEVLNESRSISDVKRNNLIRGENLDNCIDCIEMIKIKARTMQTCENNLNSFINNNGSKRFILDSEQCTVITVGKLVPGTGIRFGHPEGVHEEFEGKVYYVKSESSLPPKNFDIKGTAVYPQLSHSMNLECKNCVTSIDLEYFDEDGCKAEVNDLIRVLKQDNRIISRIKSCAEGIIGFRTPYPPETPVFRGTVQFLNY
ncbi:MAG: hypothetical protein HON90_13525 [Halobacteriovoraceae bacterium]|jgi:hypothetical protein|nr:hypothetical protein [Halobacteriovoraceae bacterium]